MYGLTPEGLRAVEDIAARNGVGTEAAATLLRALVQGGGTQAQFSHPELGGMGQWSQGGMIMVGDMFNQGLKYRVDALCNELSALLRQQSVFLPVPQAAQSQSQSNGNHNGNGVSLFVSGAGASWWPAELGSPNSTGAQNDLRYAWFQGTQRLAIQQGGRLRVYDTGNHLISGFGQQQGNDQSITFVSQFGVVRVADLPEITAETPHPAEATPSEPPAPTVTVPPMASDNPQPRPTPAAPANSDEIFKVLERLAELHQKGIVTAEEFAAKKAELLSRL